MTDLTQDWKDGKLKEGLYYIKLNTGKAVIDFYKENEYEIDSIIKQDIDNALKLLSNTKWR